MPFAASLGASCRSAPEAEPRSVRGVLVDLTATSLTSVGSFELRAEDGRRLSFRADGDVGMTPAHLREHMVLGEPITVTYRELAEGLLALRVED